MTRREIWVDRGWGAGGLEGMGAGSGGRPGRMARRAVFFLGLELAQRWEGAWDRPLTEWREQLGIAALVTNSPFKAETPWG